MALVVPAAAGFPDNWIYVHSPDVAVGRIQNFGQWSPYMVRDGTTCLGLEYFVFEGDELWETDDATLVERATGELGILGLVDPAASQRGYVVRVKKAYPYYDFSYKENVADGGRLARRPTRPTCTWSGATGCTSTTTRTTRCSRRC